MMNCSNMAFAIVGEGQFTVGGGTLQPYPSRLIPNFMFELRDLIQVGS